MTAAALVGKAALVFAVGYIFVRLMKKHSMGTTTPLDFLIAVILGDILAEPVLSDRMDLTILSAGTVVLAHVLLSRLVMWRPLRRIVSFSPTVLVKQGEIDESALSRERVTIPHLLAELRVKGYPNVADVACAILEETGDISVLPRSDKRPVEPADLGLRPPAQGMPTALILDGHVVDSGLSALGRDRGWLTMLLGSYGIREDAISRISLATLGASGKLHVDYFG